MRLRLGLLQDPAAIERQIQRELKEAEKKRAKELAPTVKTEAETKADEEAQKKERKDVEDHVKAAHKPPRIRPLSENKAIETGATFIAETFLFLVAGGLILAESWRRDRKEKKQDADVNDALTVAEKEREEMRAKLELLQAEIEALMDNKRPFDSVRAAAVASIRHAPSSTEASTKSRNESSHPITGAAQASPAGLPTVTQDTVAAKADSPSSTASKPTEPKRGDPITTLPPNATSTVMHTPDQSSNTPVSSEKSPPNDGSQPSLLSSWLPNSWTGGGSQKPDES